ncbi:MAG: hypothetical protein GY822_07095, partial [Deltaproteobacteria bacterium]|nr:hypothetical protein [Deltaproteobacteria bacterium]
GFRTDVSGEIPNPGCSIAEPNYNVDVIRFLLLHDDIHLLRKIRDAI